MAIKYIIRRYYGLCCVMLLSFMTNNMFLLIVFQRGNDYDQARAAATVYKVVNTLSEESTVADLVKQNRGILDKNENKSKRDNFNVDEYSIPYPINDQLNEDTADYDAESEEAQKTRLTRLRESCPYCDMGSTSWCKYTLQLQHMIVDDVHKTIFCSIPKCASTKFERLLLESTNSEINPSEIITHNRAYYKLHGLRYLDMYKPHEAGYRLNHYFKFLVVRDPFERLVSAYVDKFEKRDPEFLDNYGKWANMLRLTGYMTKYSPVNSSVSFSDLVDIIIKQHEDNLLLDQHWATYESLCETCAVKYDYIAKFETYRNDFQHLIKRFCNGSNCEIYASERNEARTTFEEVNKYFAQLTPKQLMTIQKIYETDMNGFGYKFKVPINNVQG